MIHHLARHLGRNLVAYVALFVALGGSAIAASEALGPRTVGTAQLKNSAVTNTKVANNAVTTTKVKNGTLLKADFKAGQLQPGPQGPAGAAGAAGPAGPPAAKFWAVINAGGSLVRGSGVSDSDRLALGQYRVKFNESVAGCSWIATANATNNGFTNGQASANKDTANEAWLKVGGFTATGGAADLVQISVAVFC